MIYAYLSDEAFAVTGTGSVLNYNDVSVTGYAVPTDKIMNYFDTVLKKGSTTEYLVQHGMILDPVYERGDGVKESEYRVNRLVIDSASGVSGGISPTGAMTLHFDKAKVVDSKDIAFLNSITITPQEESVETTRKAKTDRRAQLFNIIEAIYMAHKVPSAGSAPLTKEELEDTVFESAPNTTYRGYVTGSLKLSATVTKAVYRYAYANGSRIDIDNAPAHDYYDHFEFEFNYGDSEETVVTIKVWLNNKLFLGDYPYSTIIDVLYPCNPAWMLYPESSGGEIQAVIAAAKYKDKQIDSAVTDNDHSGASIFTSRYVHPIVGSNSRMSFVVMYKGNTPSSADMRIAVRDALTSEVDNYGNKLAEDPEWKAILPDLFIDAEFYLIPCYFQRVPYSPTVTIERSIVNYRSLYNKMIRLFPNSDPQKIFDYMEILQAPGHDMYIIALPVDLGKEGNVPLFNSVLKLHPTYQPLSSIGTSKKFIRTSDTKYMSGKTYYYVQGNSPNYLYTEVDAINYEVGDTIPSSTPLYELALDAGTVKKYVRTSDETFVSGKTYYYREGNSPVYEYTAANPTDYTVGETIPASLELYELKMTVAGHWNTMTYTTKEFAQLLSNCLAVCIDERSAHHDDFTESEISDKKYFTFGCNYIEYHMLSLLGAKGIFDAELVEDCEHVDGYIH